MTVRALEPIDLDSLLRDEGVVTDPIPGWETRSRPFTFAPAGVMVHHTAGRDSLNIIVNGRSDLPGPLAHLLIAKTGLAYVVSANYCNHAGRGNSDVLARVRAELEPRYDRHPSIGDIVGNRYFYGIEVENLGNGTDPYPPEQIDALVRSCRAILNYHGWHPNRIRHHRQWTARKTDMSWTGDIIALVAAEEDTSVILSRTDWRRIQDNLKALGFNAGPSDGIPGPNTLEAVQGFQAAERLDQSEDFVPSPGSFRGVAIPDYTGWMLASRTASFGIGQVGEVADKAFALATVTDELANENAARLDAAKKAL